MKTEKNSIVSFMVGIIIGIFGSVVILGKIFGDALEKKQFLSDKHLALFLMMNQWVKVKQNGKNIASYLETKQYRKIAIYGMSYVGKTLISELQDTNIDIMYGIDKNADKICSDIHLVSMEDELQKVDVVIVTSISFFEDIKKDLSLKVDCPIISLEDILYDA